MKEPVWRWDGFFAFGQAASYWEIAQANETPFAITFG
jgi:hypothetical protein